MLIIAFVLPMYVDKHYNAHNNPHFISDTYHNTANHMECFEEKKTGWGCQVCIESSRSKK